MITVNHEESIPRRQNDMCMRCRCEDGMFQCSMPDDEEADCRRSDPVNNNRQDCMMDGQMVMHNEQREVKESTAIYLDAKEL